MDILLSVQQVAGILGTSESTVRRMEERGDLAVFGDGQYRFNLANVLSIRSEKSRTKAKFSVCGIKAKDLKEVAEKLEDDETNITLVIEEFDPPGPVAGKYLTYPKGFATVSVYGSKFGKSWVV